jgi:hypothetical protein
VPLWRAPNQPAVDRTHGLGHLYPSSEQVDPDDAQRCCLAEPLAGIGQECDQQSMRTSGPSELAALGVREIVPVLLGSGLRSPASSRRDVPMEVSAYGAAIRPADAVGR